MISWNDPDEFDQSGYTSWTRWIDAHVERVPWPVVVGMWFALGALFAKAF